VGGGIAAPTALAHYDRGEVEVEGLAHARLYAAIGGATADDDGVAPQHVQQFGDPRPIEGARPALQEDVVGEVGLYRSLDRIGARRVGKPTRKRLTK
jgi:hypothetical protein